MSVSRWRWTEACEGQPCCGDCDSCTEVEDEEDDGPDGGPDRDDGGRQVDEEQ